MVSIPASEATSTTALRRLFLDIDAPLAAVDLLGHLTPSVDKDLRISHPSGVVPMEPPDPMVIGVDQPTLCHEPSLSSTSVLVTDDGVWSRVKTEDSGVPATDRKRERPKRAAATGILLFQ